MDAIVIQCCLRKQETAGTFITRSGRIVKFVAHPNKCRTKRNVMYARPDDYNPETFRTWREHLIEYNRNKGNPLGLIQAANLYRPEVYHNLAECESWKTFILSAGWGLVRSDYLLPAYDITFSASADDCNRRAPYDQYSDFNHLEKERYKALYFFGGVDYLPLFFQLTQKLSGRKVIFYRSKHLEKTPGYDFVRYKKKRMTNWHYDCAMDFIEGGYRR
jgi:hypothetical protein